MRENFDFDKIKKLVKKVFPKSGSLSIEPVEEGVSTNVYKLRKDREIFYLRVAHQKEESFDPEALVLNLLLKKGVKVPKVLHYENYNEVIQRSFMIVTEIKGKSMGVKLSLRKAENVLNKAGQDLAIINSLPVKNFGWIQRYRDGINELEGEFDDYRDFALNKLEENLKFLIDKNVLNKKDELNIYKIIKKFPQYLSYKQARLAHGDFDVSHIYEQNGEYTGIIDFGDIRGASPYFDLAHFDVSAPQFSPYLLQGYQKITRLPGDFELRMSMAGLFFMFVKLTWIGRKLPEHFEDHPAADYIKNKIERLITVD